MDRTLSQDLGKNRERDMLARATASHKQIMASAFYEIDAERRREIEKIVTRAKKVLLK